MNCAAFILTIKKIQKTICEDDNEEMVYGSC